MKNVSKSIPPDIFNLLEFLVGFNSWNDEKRLYHDVNNFLTTHLRSKEMLVFSYSQKFKHAGTSNVMYAYRCVWNKDFGKLGYKKSEIIEFMNYIDAEEIQTTKIFQMELFGESYIALYLGETKYQKYFGIIGKKAVSDSERTILNFLTKFTIKAFSAINKWKELIEENSLIHVDDVTGLYNIRKLNIDLDFGIKRFQDTGENFAVLFIDIDHFKNVNDGHGHLVGTQLLTDLANILRHVLRATDYIYRYGGDEFVIIIPDANTFNAKSIGERILGTVKHKIFGVKDSKKKFKMTVSIGIASFPDDASTREDVLAIADQMMYHAKAAGRGKVCFAGELFSKAKKTVKKAV